MMEALLLLCLLGGDPFHWAVEKPSFSWNTEKGGDPTEASPQDAESSPTDGLSDYVHRINVANQGGSCVCIGDGVFITCKHVFEGVGVRDVRIDGQAVAASVTFAPSHDVAIVRVSGLLPMGNILSRTETPAHMSECRAFGHGSEVIHTGVYSNDDTLSLMPGPGGITQGDSGGGVFCDGQLVGVIRGKNPGNSRVCYFTPLSDVAALVAPFSPEAEPEAAPGADSKPVITITVADFHCPPCNVVKGYDWSDFDVRWHTGGHVERGYPEISWVVDGKKRWKAGAYTPSQVMSMWEQTQ